MNGIEPKILFSGFLRLCIKETLRTTWEKSDLAATIAGVVLPVIVHFVPAWEHAVNNIVWEIPIACLVSIGAMRLLISPFLVYRTRDLEARKLASKVESLMGPVKFVAGHSATEQTSNAGLPMIVHRVLIRNDSSMVAEGCQLVIRKFSLQVPGLSMDTPLNIKDADMRRGDIARSSTVHFDLFMTFHKANRGDTPHGTYVLAPNTPSIPWTDEERLEEIILMLQGGNFDAKFWKARVRIIRGDIEIMGILPSAPI